jgi:hypothetical protein
MRPPGTKRGRPSLPCRGNEESAMVLDPEESPFHVVEQRGLSRGAMAAVLLVILVVMGALVFLS